MAKVGVVGLGDMGSGMAERLLDAKHEVHGWNRTRAKAERLASRGLILEETPRAVAEACELTIAMVSDNAALHAVCEGDDGIVAGMGAGKIFAEMSTTAPALVRELAERVRERGGALVDAPVSGSILTLRQGKLLIMVGGDEAVCKRAEPILLAIGPTVKRVGDVGQAKAMKIGVNLSLAVQMLAFSEGVLLAERSGVDRRVAFEAFLHSVIASPMLQYRAPFALDPPEYAWFDTKMMQKDLSLALELGNEVQVPLPATAAAQEVLTATRAAGFAKEDFAVIFHGLASMAGIPRDPATIPPYAREAEKG
ncbi:MAG TPA: NAD(P)-dependent oxidoreductase [Candidatus Baltobacteraceae bacterium]|nr:NAD(P)-dependent oxidoreductase [Candidatus Baltobacteraceae bacterium]